MSVKRHSTGWSPDWARGKDERPIASTGWQSIEMDNSPLTAQDEALIERIRSGKQGAKFEALMRGDLSAHNGDQSQADLALASPRYWPGAAKATHAKYAAFSGYLNWQCERSG